MTRNITALIGFVLLAGCSGGGGDSATTSTAPPPPTPTAQPDMLTATSQGILRGKANGQGQREILRAPNLLQSNVSMDAGNIVYHRNQGDGGGTDIWTVRADGTGDRALRNTANSEFVGAVSWPWLIYYDRAAEFTKTLNAETNAEYRIDDAGGGFINFHNNRVIITSYSSIISQSFTGTDDIRYVHATGPEESEMLVPAFVGDRLISIRPSNLFSFPFLGGTAIPLDSGQSYVSWGGSIGSRVVYHRCQLGGGPCDVVSVQNDGTSPVVLTSHPANEAVQGVTTNQVIIRRNLSGNDHLIAVPVTGGAETLLMTMTDNEFVETIVEDTIIVRRPSGTWSLNLSGTLKQLNNIAGLDGFVPVGNAICSSDVVWCMPLDGSAPAVKIANTGRVVGVL